MGRPSLGIKRVLARRGLGGWNIARTWNHPSYPLVSDGSLRPCLGPGRLTHSAARTDLVLLIRHTVRPRGYACSRHKSRKPGPIAFHVYFC
jgi:hypothetical protein